jgi:hypothetical protein
MRFRVKAAATSAMANRSSAPPKRNTLREARFDRRERRER